MQSEYKIDLETYNGPLDLLLYLINREEVDIYDIPIARITNQYMQYLGELQKVDIGLAGDFLVMASTLMYIKSRMLLPRSEIIDSDEEEDPRLELVKQLLEYKKYKESTTVMAKWAEEKIKRFPRPKEKIINEDEVEQVYLEEIDIWKIAQLFSNFVKQTLGDVSKIIVQDNIPIRTYMQKIVSCLFNVYDISFKRLFFQGNEKRDVIGYFLALLELARLRKVRFEQVEDFGEIRVMSND